MRNQQPGITHPLQAAVFSQLHLMNGENDVALDQVQAVIWPTRGTCPRCFMISRAACICCANSGLCR